LKIKTDFLTRPSNGHIDFTEDICVDENSDI
jgi:hypothetical protein